MIGGVGEEVLREVEGECVVDGQIREGACGWCFISFGFLSNLSLISLSHQGFIALAQVWLIFLSQLTEEWGEELFSALSRAGGKAFSNMAVGYNNVDVDAANKYSVAVGNTPLEGRIVEADEFMRAGLYDKWLPHLFVGNLLKGQTVGVIGAGSIGSAICICKNDVDLDVFEDEPFMKPGLAEQKNAIVVPHMASASKGKIKGYPVWFDANRVEPFLNENARPPAACPSIFNAKALGIQ
ncbi:hypothetical protein Fmac_018773 [Flemingia macrophylla]|uniref:D-isomer specific 2-hydroxyacid dehydrogenase catalytic domain-containing protein n=1 Tax=Flemingia macrophylla TaxID=520843 RepID=A0ABD1M5Y3_9FABA